MRLNFRISLILLLAFSFHIPPAAAADWDPVADAEKAMKSNPLDPGAGAVVLFKRGEIDVLEKGFWSTKIRTYARIKVFTDAGRDAARFPWTPPRYSAFQRSKGAQFCRPVKSSPWIPRRYSEARPMRPEKFRHLGNQLHISLGRARRDHRVSNGGRRGLVLSSTLDFRHP